MKNYKSHEGVFWDDLDILEVLVPDDFKLDQVKLKL